MTMIEFQAFPKIARLSRECIVTEKIDGSNAAVCVVSMIANDFAELPPEAMLFPAYNVALIAQSRSRFITPGMDNFGFALWVREHAIELMQLGIGTHFGEWWGSGIQRGYGLSKGERRFSLFNVSRWADDTARPSCCHVVPEIWRGEFDTSIVRMVMDNLSRHGSFAAPGFIKPEGVVIFHTQSGYLFKKTFEKDEAGKEHGA